MASDITVHNGGPRGIQHEGEAGGSIDPGQLLEYDTDADTFVTHSSAATAAQTHFCDEKPYGGDDESTTDPMDDGYSSGDYVWTTIYEKGSVITGVLDSGESVSAGTYLVSAGNGNVRALNTSGGDTQGAVLARARESVSTGTSSTERVEMEVL